MEPSLQDKGEFLYAAQPELLRFRTAQLAVAEAIDWYQSRAKEIERHAGQVRPSVTTVTQNAMWGPGYRLRCWQFRGVTSRDEVRGEFLLTFVGVSFASELLCCFGSHWANMCKKSPESFFTHTLWLLIFCVFLIHLIILP